MTNRNINSWAEYQQYMQRWYGDLAEQSLGGVTGGSIREGEQPTQLTTPVTLRPVCVCDCGQEIREPASGWKFGFPFKYCGDCRAARDKDLDLHDLDTRIAAARSEPAYGDVGPWDERDAEYEL